MPKTSFAMLAPINRREPKGPAFISPRIGANRAPRGETTTILQPVWMGAMIRQRSGCPINLTLETFGDRWSLIVLRDIMFGQNRSFRALLAESIEGIASNILADRLKRLTANG